jgi:isocitrate lyase
MTEKIRITQTFTYEYKPDPEDYKDAETPVDTDSPEAMLTFDLECTYGLHDNLDIRSLTDNAPVETAKWELVTYDENGREQHVREFRWVESEKAHVEEVKANSEGTATQTPRGVRTLHDGDEGMENYIEGL